jgi:hypothetical protein
VREILFRGKDVKTGEWVYGYYQEEQTGSYIYLKEEDWFCEVIPESLGQYIGKNDKNNRHIFEGDILETSDGKHYCVYYNESEAACHLKYFAGVVRGVYHNVVIIGNTTDNPELLEGIK